MGSDEIATWVDRRAMYTVGFVFRCNRSRVVCSAVFGVCSGFFFLFWLITCDSQWLCGIRWLQRFLQQYDAQNGLLAMYICHLMGPACR